MDRPAPAPPQQRDIVYCHQCENEWYRDEHGMTPCPECGGEFTEVVEEGSDPRDAPDPEEEDIDHFEWRRNEAGDGRQFHATMNRTININTLNGLQGGQGGGGLMGLLGGVIQSALGTAQQARNQQQQPPQPGQQAQQNDAARSMSGALPGQQQGDQPGVFVRHQEGPGYSYTIRSNVSLFPRDANGPQPAQHQPDDIDRIMANMFANIGAHPGGPGNFRFGPPPFGHGEDDLHMGGGPPAGPLANIFRMFGMPAMGGAHGDAVYSQEAFDRIITQFMEQNATGNAPGPASEQAINSLPKKKISESDLDEEGKADCTICMDTVPVGEEVTVLPCSHWFHFDCIKMWLAEHDTCPHCRQGIMPHDQPQSNNARSPSQPPLNDTHLPEYHGQRSMPGGFPFPQPTSSSAQATGEGSQQNPITIPESPQQERPGSASGTMFARMRNAFGGSAGGGDDGPSDQHIKR